MRARSCGAVRCQLSAYHDGELTVEEQIAVEGHLRECPSCQAEARDLRSLSAMIRVAAAPRSPRERDLDSFPSSVIIRMKAERAESIVGRTQRMFDDLHLVWAALGATGATVACLAMVFTLFYFAVREERPDSLGAIIAGMSSPAGSNQNPLGALDDGLRLPSALDNAAFPAALTNDEDAVFALAAVVTREGKIANLKMLHENDGEAPAMNRQERQAVEALLDNISKARFEPARYGNSPVAVNMVWLYAQMTVRGKVPSGSHMRSPSKAVISQLTHAPSLAV